MQLSYLTAISPLDGRYSKDVSSLRNIFSEFGLFKFRLQIEIRWLQKLSACSDIKELPCFDDSVNNYLNDIISNFSMDDAQQIKNIENKINHDVKAVEYFLKDKISHIPILNKFKEFIHFACTSEDINNIAYALMLNITRKDILLPSWYNIISKLKFLAINYRSIPLLSRTHGQPATPSTFGKEIANFSYRLLRQYQQMKNINILGKMNGTVGNYNAHLIAYPKLNWQKFSKEFVTSFGINWNCYTTQIEPHDYIAELLHCILRFNTILIDLNRDFWGYISLNYFKQFNNNKEIGSSIMPHKINPIFFEKSEGNLGFANSIINYLATTLPISRWQRDLTDSTLLRNLGVGIGHSLIAYESVLKGLKKLKINKDLILAELNQNWAILAEPIQTLMRRYGIDKPYEKLKELTCCQYVDADKIKNFIDNLPLPELEKTKLKKITPANYIGYASSIIDDLNYW